MWFFEVNIQSQLQAIGSNYDLGIHFFDKRMMHKAEARNELTRRGRRLEQTGSAFHMDAMYAYNFH